jgi:hypothetical protein
VHRSLRVDLLRGACLLICSVLSPLRHLVIDLSAVTSPGFGRLRGVGSKRLDPGAPATRRTAFAGRPGLPQVTRAALSLYHDPPVDLGAHSATIFAQLRSVR